MITSISDLLNAQGHFPRQRFVEYFSGKGGTNIPSAIWTLANGTGSGSGAMVDAINEGFEISCGAVASAQSGITFNHSSGQRPFSPTSSKVTLEARAVSSTSRRVLCGLDASAIPNNHFVFVDNDTNNTNFELHTADATNSLTASDVAIDQSWHTHTLELSSGDNKLTIDGTLKVTKTTNRPTNALQPSNFILTRDSTAKDFRMRYYEVYNK